MIAGITGHQNIGDSMTIEWVERTITETISKYDIHQGYTCLAVGSDQLYAELLRENNLPYTVIIPSNQYEQTFLKDTDLKKYQDLLSAAHEIIKLRFEKPTETAFYEAGKQVVDSSDIVIAIWNGQKAKGLGGTGDIVKYAISKGRKIIHINPITSTVSEIN
jgi:hypothetical protein